MVVFSTKTLAGERVVARFTELQTAIDKLVADLADVPLSDEQAASVDDVAAKAQRLDDLNSDIIPVEPPVV